MRTTLLTILTASAFLVACSPQSTSLSEQLNNPLTAARYGDELADTMANFLITKNPIVDKPGFRDLIEQEIERGKTMGNEAREKMNQGMMGGIIPMMEASGLVLYLDDVLYFSSDFYSRPGPSLHVFLTTLVDPRDAGAFPDDTALDLGTVQNLYGAQQYSVPHQDQPDLYRTFVLYDTKLQIIYAFAQLAKNY